jgi:hypothetical protein
MKIAELTPAQETFLELFASGTTFPDAVAALSVSPETLAIWRTQKGFSAGHLRACLLHLGAINDLLQIEEIRSYLANNPLVLNPQVEHPIKN